MASGTSNDVVVRMHPYDPGKGHVMRTCTLPDPNDPLRVLKFKHDHDGWYRVSPEAAEILKKLHSRPENPNSPLAFMVRSTAEILEEARQEKQRRETVDHQANIVDMGAAEAAAASSSSSSQARSSKKSKPGRMGSPSRGDE